MSDDTYSPETAEKIHGFLYNIDRITNGGRNLFAVHENHKLDRNEKHLILVIAGYMDFTTLNTKCSYCQAKVSFSRSQLAERMSFSEPRTGKVADKLAAKGYIKKIQTFSPDGKKCETSLYQITDKIFVEYAEQLGLPLEEFIKILEAKKSQPQPQKTKKGKSKAPTAPSEGGYETNPPPPPTPPNSATASIEGGYETYPGVGTKRTNSIPSKFLKEDNTKVLSRGVDEPHPPKNKPKSKNDTPKNRSRELFRTIYRRERQPSDGKGFVRVVSNATLDVVFGRLYGTYSENDFKELYDLYESNRQLGARDWDPNRPAQDLEVIKMQSETVEPEPETRTGYIPPELRAEADQDLH